VTLGRGSLTEHDHELIEQLAGEGVSANAIARRIGKHPSTVQWFMYSHGLAAPKQREAPMSYWRGNRQVHRFTRIEDSLIEALRVDGSTPEQIAEICSKRFGTQRSHHTIRCRLKMLAAAEGAA
jgi:IS30 family transposase